MATDIARRILDGFGADETFEGVDLPIRPGDLYLLLPAVLMAVFIYELVASIGGGSWLSNTAGTILGVGLILVTVVLIFVTPAEEPSTWAWVRSMVSYRLSDSERSAVDTDPRNRPDTLTQVAQFHPNSNTMERTDGNLVGGVRVSPANMSLATAEEWDRTADAFGDALNSIDFDVLLYSTARDIDPDRIVGAYADRADDRDVKENETLARIIDVYQRHFPSEFAARGTSVREYYMLVPVSPRDVQMREYGAFEKLRQLDGVGEIYETVAGEMAGLSDEELRAEQHRELQERIDDVVGAIQSLDECEARILSSNDLARVIEEYWTGERTEYDETSDRMRSVPVVVSETNRAGSTTPTDDGEYR